MTDIKSYIENQASLISTRLEQVLDINVDNVVTDAMKYSVKNGGKRIRPFLTLEFAKACNGNLNVALDFGCAVEMIHTYSLIHDDLPCMDNDDMRRGKPSCHKAFGEANALLAGDALLTEAFALLIESNCDNDIPNENIVNAVWFLSQLSGISGMIGGQTLDLEFEETKPTVEQILKMYTLKTGALIASSCVLGCLSAKEYNQQKIDSATKYAENLGLAFQIQDDILDITSDEVTLGKPVGSDEKNDKSTIVKFFGLEKAKEMVNEYTQKAIDALDGIDGDTTTLKEFALYMANRTH
ncbi:MAG: polyprenyl synthetase family protein [Clostridia bacterium]|nr:polyprenyl synthetase family protein [Clostridia bacterium]